MVTRGKNECVHLSVMFLSLLIGAGASILVTNAESVDPGLNVDCTYCQCRKKPDVSGC